MNVTFIDIKKFLNSFLILFWVLSGGSVYFVLNRNGCILSFLAFILTLLFLYKPKIIKKNVKSVLLSLILVLLLLTINYAFSLKPQDYTKYGYIYFEFLVGAIFCLYIYATFTYNEFTRILYKVLKFIRLHALLSAILISLFPFLFTVVVNNEFSGYKAQSFIYIFFKVSDQYSFNFLGLNITRNQGLFWEPGVLQLYLNLLLLFQLYVVRTKNIDIFLTIICIITTYSTSAYAIMLIVMLSYLIQLIWKRPWLLLPISLIFLLVFVPLFRSNVENKFQGDHQTSSLVRVYDFIQQITIIKENFITGVGLDDQRYEKIRLNYGISKVFQNVMGTNQVERGSTNSVLFLLATMGVFMGGILLYAFANQNLIKEKNTVLTILLLIGVMVEPLLLKPFFITLTLSGLMGLWLKKNKEQHRFWRKNYSSDVLKSTKTISDYKLSEE